MDRLLRKKRGQTHKLDTSTKKQQRQYAAYDSLVPMRSGSRHLIRSAEQLDLDDDDDHDQQQLDEDMNAATLTARDDQVPSMDYTVIQ